MISWGISAFYFHIGNRNNVLMSVVNPMKQILEYQITYEEYRKLEQYSKEYSVRYLKKKERKIICELLISYKEMCRYDYKYICAESLEMYFMDTLKKNKINTDIEPVWIEGDIVAYGKPQEMIYFSEDVGKILKEYPPEIEESRCLEKVVTTFEQYCKNYFKTDKKIMFFEDCTFWDVINKSENKKEWDKKKHRFKELKDLVLKIDR